jgi:hypothetical protein
VSFRINLDQPRRHHQIDQEKQHDNKVDGHSQESNASTADLPSFERISELNIIIETLNNSIKVKTRGLIADNVFKCLFVFNVS